MNIFESLENLEISEECFNDIVHLIKNLLNEDIKSAIIKKYGEPKYNKGFQKHYHWRSTPSMTIGSEAGLFRTPRKNSKAAQLTDKIERIQKDERIDSDLRSGQGYSEYGSSQMKNKRDMTKNLKGERKTKKHRDLIKGMKVTGKGYDQGKSEKEAVDASINRHKNKEEKKN